MVVKCKLVWQQKINIELIIAFELRVHWILHNHSIRAANIIRWIWNCNKVFELIARSLKKRVWSYEALNSEAHYWVDWVRGQTLNVWKSHCIKPFKSSCIWWCELGCERLTIRSSKSGSSKLQEVGACWCLVFEDVPTMGGNIVLWKHIEIWNWFHSWHVRECG